MINKTTTRIVILVVAILATSLSIGWIKQKLTPPEVEMPNWTFNEMPLQLGDWRGEAVKWDPKIAAATEAEIIVNRAYRDDAGHTISLHTSVFKNPAHGVYHSPMNCYPANGWQKIKAASETLHLPNGVVLPVRLVTWERDNRRVIIAYWYQLGEHVLFGRWDLGVKVRWSLAGRPKWPALVKVLMEISLTDKEDARAALLDFAEKVAAWENLPAHQTGLGSKTGAGD